MQWQFSTSLTCVFPNHSLQHPITLLQFTSHLPSPFPKYILSTSIDTHILNRHLYISCWNISIFFFFLQELKNTHVKVNEDSFGEFVAKAGFVGLLSASLFFASDPALAFKVTISQFQSLVWHAVNSCIFLNFIGCKLINGLFFFFFVILENVNRVEVLMVLK